MYVLLRMAASGWIGIKNYQVARASKQYNFQAETHSTGYKPISTNSTN